MKNTTDISSIANKSIVHTKSNFGAINRIRSLILVPSLVSALLINPGIATADGVNNNDNNKRSTENSMIDNYIAQWECGYLFIKLSRDKNNGELKKEYNTKCDKTATPKK